MDVLFQTIWEWARLQTIWGMPVSAISSRSGSSLNCNAMLVLLLMQPAKHWGCHGVWVGGACSGSVLPCLLAVHGRSPSSSSSLGSTINQKNYPNFLDYKRLSISKSWILKLLKILSISGDLTNLRSDKYMESQTNLSNVLHENVVKITLCHLLTTKINFVPFCATLRCCENFVPFWFGCILL